MFGCVSCAAWKVADSLEEIKNDLDGWVPDPKIEFGAVAKRSNERMEPAQRKRGAVAKRKRQTPQKRKSESSTLSRTTK